MRAEQKALRRLPQLRLVSLFSGVAQHLVQESTWAAANVVVVPSGVQLERRGFSAQGYCL
jgi:hypothetical protein